VVRLLTICGIVALALVTTLHSPASTDATIPVKFTSGQVAGSGFSVTHPTTLAIGPDGRRCPNA
jgi:hypothetical protein